MGEALPGIIIGTDLINERTKQGTYDRMFARGCEIILTLLPMTQQGVPSASGAITVAMRYADDSHTRVYEIDKLCVYVDFDRLQRYLSMDPQEMIDGGFTPARASQVLIKIADGVDAFEAKGQVEAVWSSFYGRMRSQDRQPLSVDDDKLMSFVQVETWQERQREYISAVEKEKVLVLILFGVISLVAVVLIGCIFYMIVSQKTRDIGIIKSIGASAAGVAGIFIAYAGAIGVIGSVLGTVTGIIFVRYINEIQDALASLNPNLRVWSPDVYAFDRIPNVVNTGEAVWIFVVAVVASMVGAVIPAMFAARVWPVKALRYE
jgi:lipoprotein-releasing system permease protein